MKGLDRQLQRFRIGKIIPFIEPGARVLDIGCADGALFRRAPRLATYVGIDPDAPGRSPSSNARFIQGTFPTPQLDACEQFDVVAALAVVEHIPLREQSAFAGACARHIVVGGYLAISVPSPMVDRILAVLKRMRLLDGMREDQHYGYDPRLTPSIFEPHGLHLHRHRRFELGLNHLFVLRRAH